MKYLSKVILALRTNVKFIPKLLQISWELGVLWKALAETAKHDEIMRGM